MSLPLSNSDYEEAVNVIIKPNVRLIDYSTKRWEDVEDIIFEYHNNLKSSKRSEEAIASNLLPRADCPLFGYMPKYRRQVLFECNTCGKLVMPCVYKEHYDNRHKEEPMDQDVTIPKKPKNNKSLKLGKASSGTRPNGNVGKK